MAYVVSQGFHDQIYNGSPEFKFKGTINNGLTTFDITQADVRDSKLSIKYSCFKGSSFAIGSTVCATISFTLNNKDGQWRRVPLSSATFNPSVGVVVDGVDEWCPMGVFVFDKTPKNLASIPITGMDKMIYFEKDFNSVTGVTYPCTLASLLSAVCTFCGVTAYSLTFHNYDMVVTSIPEKTDRLTCRDIVGYIAQLAGGFARMTRTGSLQIASFPAIPLAGYIDGSDFYAYVDSFTMDGDSTANEWIIGGSAFDDSTLDQAYNHLIDVSAIYDGQVNDTPINITGIKYDNGKSVYQIGSDGYLITVDNNPLISGDESEISDKLNGIMNQLWNFSYVPFECEMLSDPTIDVGIDIIKFVDANDYPVFSIPTNYEYNYNSRCRCEAVGESAELVPIQESGTKAIAKLQAKTSYIERSSSQFADLLANSMGQYTTTETNSDGSVVIYQHDQPLLANSTMIWKKTADAFGWSSDGGTTWNGISADGNMLAAVLTAIGINADWITTGIVKSADNSTYFDLDNSKIVASGVGINEEIRRVKLDEWSLIFDRTPYTPTTPYSYHEVGSVGVSSYALLGTDPYEFIIEGDDFFTLSAAYSSSLNSQAELLFIRNGIPVYQTVDFSTHHYANKFFGGAWFNDIGIYVNDVTTIDSLADIDAPIIIGDNSGYHMMLASNKIQCADGSSALPLYLNSLGGNVYANNNLIYHAGNSLPLLGETGMPLPGTSLSGDFNSFVTAGAYSISGTYTNGWTTGNIYGVLWIFKRTSSQIFQLAFSTTNGMHTRFSNDSGSTWSSWSTK